jgi:hypothetical protein
MTSDGLVDFLRKQVRAPIERNARAIVRDLNHDAKAIERFQLDRVHLDELINELEEGQLEDVDKRLRELSEPLSAGAKAMKQALGKVRDFAEGAQLFATVVGLVARIVALA